MGANRAIGPLDCLKVLAGGFFIGETGGLFGRQRL
jgi:hypothetical protein